MRNTASPCSGRVGGPPFEGLKTNSTNSMMLAVQKCVSWHDLFSLFVISLFLPTPVLWQFSMCSSLFKISKRIAVYKLLKTNTLRNLIQLQSDSNASQSIKFIGKTSLGVVTMEDESLFVIRAFKMSNLSEAGMSASIWL